MEAFKNIKAMMAKAQESEEGMKQFNDLLQQVIPFNQPHDIRVDGFGPEGVTASIPYMKSNFNHIQGIHACALATLSEYATGLFLLAAIDGSIYRIIMQKFEVEYFYQAKEKVVAKFGLPATKILNEVIIPLKSQDSVVLPCEVKLNDVSGNHISTATIYWQIKPWDKVRTKLS